MLDRYGISCLCQHSEIRFAGPYVPTIRLYRHGDRFPAVDTLDGSPAPFSPETSDEIAMRLDRMVEAYAILNQICAPLDAARTEGPAGSRHVQPRQQRDRA